MPLFRGATITRWQTGPALVIVLSALAMLVALLQTILVPVLGTMSKTLGISTVAVSWVVTINLLAAVVLTPILSKAGDLFGRRRIILWSTVAVVVGSLLAAMTSSFVILLIARVIQGATFCFLPLAMGILRDNIAIEKLPLAMSLVTGAIGIGAGAGLVTTGVLTKASPNYHTIFWFVAAVSFVLLFFCIAIIPADKGAVAGKIDWWGGITLGISLVLLLLFFTQGNVWGWMSLVSMACAVGSVVVFSVWLWVERHVEEPLVPPAMLRDRTLGATNIISFFVGFGIFLVFLGITAFVQVPAEHGHGFGATVFQTSIIYLLPAGAIGIIASPLGGFAVSRLGSRSTLIMCSFLGIAGYLQLFFWHSEPWHIIFGSVVCNASFSIGFAAIPAVIVSVVRLEETAVANSLASLTRSAGSAVASALVVTLIAAYLMPDGQPSVRAFEVIFLIGAASMTMCLVLALLAIGPKSDLVKTTMAPTDHLS